MTPPSRPDEIEPLPDSVWIYEREPKRARGGRMKNFLTDWPSWIFAFGASLGMVIAAHVDLDGWQFILGGMVIGLALALRDGLEERRQRG